MTIQAYNSELFELRLYADAIESITTAIHQAMESGGYSLDTYVPAVWLVSRLMNEHAKRLEALGYPPAEDAEEREGAENDR